MYWIEKQYFDDILIDILEYFLEQCYNETRDENPQCSLEEMKTDFKYALNSLRKELPSGRHSSIEYIYDYADTFGFDIRKYYDYETHTYHRRERDPMFSLTDDDK